MSYWSVLVDIQVPRLAVVLCEYRPYKGELFTTLFKVLNLVCGLKHAQCQGQKVLPEEDEESWVLQITLWAINNQTCVCAMICAGKFQKWAFLVERYVCFKYCQIGLHRHCTNVYSLQRN